MSGELEVVAGLKNKFQAAISHIVPGSVLAELHRGMVEPGTGQRKYQSPRVSVPSVQNLIDFF